MRILRYNVGSELPLLRALVGSGIASHIMVTNSAPQDQGSAWSPQGELEQAVAICADASIPVIYGEYLWPSGATEAMLYSPTWLADRVAWVNERAEKLGAALTCLDTEVYILPGSDLSNEPLMAIYRRSMTPQEGARLGETVTKAVELIGQVDYILPAMVGMIWHMADLLRGLGRLWIDESYERTPSPAPYLKSDVRGIGLGDPPRHNLVEAMAYPNPCMWYFRSSADAFAAMNQLTKKDGHGNGAATG